MATLQSAPFHFLLLFQLIFFGLQIPRVTAIEDEEFTEELLLKPLPDRKTIAHFHFQTRSPRTDSYGKHRRLFPKSIYQLVGVIFQLCASFCLKCCRAHIDNMLGDQFRQLGLLVPVCDIVAVMAVMCVSFSFFLCILSYSFEAVSAVLSKELFNYLMLFCICQDCLLVYLRIGTFERLNSQLCAF